MSQDQLSEIHEIVPRVGSSQMGDTMAATAANMSGGSILTPKITPPVSALDTTSDHVNLSTSATAWATITENSAQSEALIEEYL